MFRGITFIEKAIEKKRFAEAFDEIDILITSQLYSPDKETLIRDLQSLIKLGNAFVNQLPMDMDLCNKIKDLYLKALHLAEEQDLSSEIILLATWLIAYYADQLTALPSRNSNPSNAYGSFAKYGQEEYKLGDQNSVVYKEYQLYHMIIFLAQMALKRLDKHENEKRQGISTLLTHVYEKALLTITVEWQEKQLQLSHAVLLQCKTMETWNNAVIDHDKALQHFIDFIQLFSERPLRRLAYSALYNYYAGIQNKINNLHPSNVNEFTKKIKAELLPSIFKQLKKLAETLFADTKNAEIETNDKDDDLFTIHSNNLPTETIAPTLFLGISYQERLEKAREEAKKDIQKGKDIRQCQLALSEKLKKVLATMWDDICQLLHAPELKQQVCLIVQGSLARGDAAPYSDIEYALLIKETRPELQWLTRMAVQWFELLMVSSGESCSTFYETMHVGFRVDQGAWKLAELCDTPEQLANHFCKLDNAENPDAYAMLISAFVWGAPSLYEDYAKAINQHLQHDKLHRRWALRRLDDNRVNYLYAVSDEKEQEHEDIKKRYLRWLTYLAMDLALYYNLSQTHPLDVINELQRRHLITKAFANCYSHYYSAIAKRRMQNHGEEHCQCDDMPSNDIEFNLLCQQTERLLLQPFVSAQQTLLQNEKILKLQDSALFEKEGVVKLLHHMCWEFSLQQLTIEQAPTSTLVIKIESSLFEKPRYLQSALIEEVIDIKTGLLREDKNTPHGRRLVIAIACDGQIIAYFKFFPELAGSEFAVSRLQELLFGDVYPRIMLAKFTATINGKDIIYPVLISEAMLGDNLQDCFENHFKQNKNYNYELPKNINLKDYTRETLLALLSFQGDGKPDGQVLVPTPQESDGEKTLSIRVVDKEQSFISSALDKNDKLQLNSVLFCMKQMGQTPDKTVLEHFVQQDGLKIFEQWLKDCQAYNNAQVELFGKDKIIQWHNPEKNIWQKAKEKITGKDTSNFSNLLFPFGDKGLEQLYSRLNLLQITTKQPELIFYDFLYAVSKRGYVLYKSIDTNISLYDHYLALGKAEFKNISSTNIPFSKYHGLQRIETLPLSCKVDNSHYNIHKLIAEEKFSPKQGLERIAQIEKTLKNHIKWIIDDLISGETKKAREALEKMLDCIWPQVLYFLKFKSIKDDLKLQAEWMLIKLDFPCEEIDFSDCQTLTGKHLEILVKKHNATVTRLSIARCSKLKLADIEKLSAMEHLEVLDASGIEQAQESEIISPVTLKLTKPFSIIERKYFSMLRRLMLNDNVFLQSLTIAMPKLEELDVTGSTNLHTLRLSGCTQLKTVHSDMAIDTLDLSNNMQLTNLQLNNVLKHIQSVRYLVLDGCIELKDLNLQGVDLEIISTKKCFNLNNCVVNKESFEKTKYDRYEKNLTNKVSLEENNSENEDGEVEEIVAKTIIVGDNHCGKSRWMSCVTGDGYVDKSTIGVVFGLVERKREQKNYRLSLWDISGQERHSSINRVYYKEAVIAVIVYNVANSRTLAGAIKWANTVNSSCWLPNTDEYIPKILVGMQIDRPREVSFEEGREVAEKIGARQYLECSNTENIGTHELVDEIVNILSGDYEKKAYSEDKWRSDLNHNIPSIRQTAAEQLIKKIEELTKLEFKTLIDKKKMDALLTCSKLVDEQFLVSYIKKLSLQNTESSRYAIELLQKGYQLKTGKQLKISEESSLSITAPIIKQNVKEESIQEQNEKQKLTLIAKEPAFRTEHFIFEKNHCSRIFSFFDNKTLVKTAPLVNKAWYLLSQKEIERRKKEYSNFFKMLFAPSHKQSNGEENNNNNNYSSQQQNQDIDKKTL